MVFILVELHALNNKENSMIDIEGLTAMNMNQPRVHLGNVAEDMNFSEHAIDSSMPPGNLYGGSAFPGMNMFSTGFNVAQNCKNQVGSSAYLFPMLFLLSVCFGYVDK